MTFLRKVAITVAITFLGKEAVAVAITKKKCSEQNSDWNIFEKKIEKKFEIFFLKKKLIFF